MRTLIIFVWATFCASGCATQRQQCDADNKAEYCEELRRGTYKAPTPPTTSAPPLHSGSILKNGDPVERHPRYQPNNP